MMEKPGIMWQYIGEEPAVLGRVMEAGEIAAFAEAAGGPLQAVYFVAHGSSLNAAVALAGFLSRTAGLRVYAYTPANFMCNASILAGEPKDGALVVAISQTGTSAGAIEALDKAKALGFSTLGITAVEGSPLAQKARWTLPLLCGEEESNAKTKGYSATLLVLLRLAVCLGRARATLGEEDAAAIEKELEGMVAALPATVEQTRAWCERTSFGDSMRDLYVLGSGLNFGTAMEGQLKLMETMCIPTMFNDIGEFSHGMHRAITPDSSLLLFKSGNAFDGLTESTFQYLKNITRHVWLVDATGARREDEQRIALPCFPRTQSILLTTLVVQVLSVFGPEHIGKDPNRDAHNDYTRFVHTRVE